MLVSAARCTVVSPSPSLTVATGSPRQSRSVMIARMDFMRRKVAPPPLARLLLPLGR